MSNEINERKNLFSAEELIDRSEWSNVPRNVVAVAKDELDNKREAAIGLSGSFGYFVLTKERDDDNIKVAWKQK